MALLKAVTVFCDNSDKGEKRVLGRYQSFFSGYQRIPAAFKRERTASLGLVSVSQTTPVGSP